MTNLWSELREKEDAFHFRSSIEAGVLLRQLQRGKSQRCHLLDRCRPSALDVMNWQSSQDQSKSWRILYRIDTDAIVILGVFRKTTQQTPLVSNRDSQAPFEKYDATK